MAGFSGRFAKTIGSRIFLLANSFSIIEVQTTNGMQETASIPDEIVQKRIVSRVDFDFAYHNPYVRYAVTDKSLSFGDVRFTPLFQAAEN